MNARQWKPGDVALVRNEHNVWNVAICAVRARHGIVWSYGVADSWMPMTADARPLVVIDPAEYENESLIVNLRDMADEAVHRFGWDATGARLNQLADQIAAVIKPRPEEPTGLGAVVEDEDGERWIRTTTPDRDMDNLNKPWTNGPVRRHWQIVAAVRVLSAGVES